MKNNEIIATAFLILSKLFEFSTYAQTTFQNLNFEDANVSGYAVGSGIPIGAALPGWSAYTVYVPTDMTFQQTQVVYDGISTGGNGISLVDARAATPILGAYSVYLFGGEGSSETLSQTGILPMGTETLLMDAYLPTGASLMPVVAINGQSITMSPLQTFANYTLYGGTVPTSDVGPSVTLSFTEPPPATGGPSIFELDNISFSPTATPEPSTLVLTLAGSALVGLRIWRGKRP